MDMSSMPDPDALMSSWYPILIAVIAGVLYGFRQYFRGVQYAGTVRMTSKVVLITGANSGIGKETVLNLAKRGAHIYMACKNVEDGEIAAEEIKTQSKNNNIIVMKCDLASFKSIREFVEIFNKRVSKLHVLINNAGVMMCPEELTEDKFEKHFQVNYLGPFLLTHLLMDKLKESAPSRIVSMTASAFRLGKINFDDINCEKEFSPGTAYSQSKLAAVLMTKELVERLDGTLVTVNCVNPGIVSTNIHRHMPIRKSAFVNVAFTPFLWYFMKSAYDGAQCLVHCAAEPTIAEETGKLYCEGKEQPMDGENIDEETQKKLYETSLKWTRTEAC